MVALVALAGCSEPRPSTLIQGVASFHDGTAVAPQQLQIWGLLKGLELFTQSAACIENDAHMAAGIDLLADIDDDGAFEAGFDVGQMTSLVNRDCPINSGTRLRDGNGLWLDAAIPASLENCVAWCRASRPADDPAACQGECLSGERKLFARAVISHEALVELEGAAPAAGVETLPVALEVTELGEPIVAGGPDLRPDPLPTEASLGVEYAGFSPDSCAVVEGCVNGPGPRRLLKFDGVIRNLGDSDFVLGNPEGQPELFDFSPCHGHYHLREAMSYELLHPDTLAPVMLDGNAVVGHKQGFCMLDIRPVAGDAEPRFYCEFQGISSGWADIYGRDLDCQWVDVTGVPPGDYTLRLTVNPGGSLPEANLDNNSVLVAAEIPPDE